MPLEAVSARMCVSVAYMVIPQNSSPNNTFNRTLARNFRKLRVKFGTSQTELGRRAKLAPSTISLFERGLISLKREQIERLEASLKDAIRQKLQSTELRKLLSEVEGALSARASEASRG